MNGTAALPRRSFGETTRPDVWWLQPLLVCLGFSTFIVYSTWAAFQGTHYFFGNYISPFYSPEIFGDSPHTWFGSKPLVRRITENFWPRPEKHTSELQTRQYLACSLLLEKTTGPSQRNTTIS